MKSTRHNGRGKDKTLDFTSPDGRNSERSAFHRYLPAESASAAIGKSTTDAADDCFEMTDFRARWWPAPDSTD